jgi:hypothetical protein
MMNHVFMTEPWIQRLAPGTPPPKKKIQKKPDSYITHMPNYTGGRKVTQSLNV